MTFRECISPLESDVFIRNVLGKKAMVFQHAGARRSTLLTINDLELALSRIVAAPGIIRLVANGRDIEKEQFLLPAPSNLGLWRVRMGACDSLLSAGATLVITHAEGLFDGVHAMCRDIGSCLGIDVRATLFAVALADKSIGTHSDATDIFVCQVFGSKKWRIHRRLRSEGTKVKYSAYISDESPGPLEVDDVVLSPGDSVYAPTGWPHNVVAVESPSIHITFDLIRPTGARLAQMALKAISSMEPLASTIPALQIQNERREYYSNVRALMSRQLSDQMLDGYMLALGAQCSSGSLTAFRQAVKS